MAFLIMQFNNNNVTYTCFNLLRLKEQVGGHRISNSLTCRIRLLTLVSRVQMFLVWHKAANMGYSVKNKDHQTHEFFFFFCFTVDRIPALLFLNNLYF